MTSKQHTRKTLLLLSGGLDSTTCLFKLLRETDDKIHTLYIDIENNAAKSWCERNALNNIVRVAKKIRSFDYGRVTKADLSGTGFGVQSMLWMFSAALVMNTIQGTRRRLCVGYTIGDSVLEYGNVAENWKYIWSQIGTERKLPPLYMPLLKRTKVQSINYLKKQEEILSESITKYLWTCEEPVIIHNTSYSGYRICGECTPCRKIKEWVDRS